MLLHISFLSEFSDYFGLGFTHIIDWRGYDHILFVVTLCAIYQFEEWRKLLVLITAFTIGHSVTLVLSTMDFIHFSQELIEVLIPVSIFLTAVHNILQGKAGISGRLFDRRQLVNYLIAMSFGIVHGMGFSNYFKFLTGAGNNVVNQLFAFNAGLEVGQLIIVSVFLLFLYLGTNFGRIKHREWNLVISGAGAGISLVLIMNTLWGL